MDSTQANFQVKLEKVVKLNLQDELFIIFYKKLIIK